MTTNVTKVVEHPVTNTQAVADYLRAKLEFGTDSADVYHDLVHQIGGFVVVDSRSLENYTKGHIPTAIRFPEELAMNRLDRSKTYVVYCDGIGCNGSTKGAMRLASVGFKAKELIGGIDWWAHHDGYPIVTGEQPGSLPALEQTSSGPSCDC
jgi:rhodanese-related sulfurtransferase